LAPTTAALDAAAATPHAPIFCGGTKRKRPSEPTFKHGGPGVDAFFTRPSVLSRIAQEVRELITPDWTFVDFSCGANEFAPALGCLFYSFDASPAANETNFTCKDWFSVEARDFGSPPCDTLAIGLNPPFGYQATLARAFVEYALTFRPQVLALIVPSQTRWKVTGYNVHTQRQLAMDSFYDPGTNKTHSEISAQFLLLTKNTPGGVAGRTEFIKTPRPTPLCGVTLTRDWNTRSYPLVIVRRVGRHAGQQFYCATATDKDSWAYVSNGAVTRGQTYRGVHSVESDYFLKVYFDPSVEDVTLDRLIELAKNMCNNPELGCELRQPHAITNVYVREMLSQWLN
jgi:hypothetical protein